MSRNLAICGKQGSGKTHFAKQLENSGWLRFSIADPIKYLGQLAYPDTEKLDECAIMHGETFTMRELYQSIGGALRSIDELFWLRILFNRIDAAEEIGRGIVIDDVRTPIEAEMLKLRGFIIVKIHAEYDLREARAGRLVGEDDITETAVDSVQADITLKDNASMREWLDLFKLRVKA